MILSVVSYGSGTWPHLTFVKIKFWEHFGFGGDELADEQKLVICGITTFQQ